MPISIQSLSNVSAELFSKAATSHWSNHNIGGGSLNAASSNIVNPDDVATRIMTSLNEPLKSYCDSFLNSNNIQSATEKVDDFEIATRGHLLCLAQTLLDANECNDIAVIEESIEDILRFFRGVIDISVYVAKKTSLDVNTSQLRKLPFQIMEDIVETLPITLIQIIWKYGPSVWLQSFLCQGNLDMFHQGSKFCLIRMCNKMLKNLSVGSQDEAAHFAGEISLILASVFPLSERSAINVFGAFHTDEKYQVEYETLEEWTENSSGGNTAAELTNDASSSSRGKKMALSYGFYSKFWSVQKFFTEPTELLPKSGSLWNQKMERFIMDIQDILGTFDGCKFSNDLIKDLNEKLEAMKRKGINISSNTDSEDVDMEDVNDIPASNTSSVADAKRQYKYLTSSHLLHLQLQDPELRIHFLSQLLIISAFLSKSLSESTSSPVGNNFADKVAVGKFLISLQGMENSAEELMRQVPPNGESHLNTLKWILQDRETAWKYWKSKKCNPPIEKFAGSVKNTSESQPNKLRVEKDTSVNSKASTYVYDLNLVRDLPKISREMSQQQSTMDHFFEEYVDALDPEAGIEKEYHPKNNKLSCWRALRLITKHHIGYLGERDGKSMIHKKTGDFEGIIRHVWKNEKGIEIPGEMPSCETISDDEDGFESNDAVASGDTADEKGIGNEDPLEMSIIDIKDNVVGDDEKQEEKSEIDKDEHAKSPLTDDQALENEGTLSKNHDKDLDNKKRKEVSGVDKKVELAKSPSVENALNQDDEEEAGEINEFEELSSSKDDHNPGHGKNNSGEENVTMEHVAKDAHMKSASDLKAHGVDQRSDQRVSKDATDQEVTTSEQSDRNDNGEIDKEGEANDSKAKDAHMKSVPDLEAQSVDQGPDQMVDKDGTVQEVKTLEKSDRNDIGEIDKDGGANDSKAEEAHMKSASEPEAQGVDQGPDQMADKDTTVQEVKTLEKSDRNDNDDIRKGEKANDLLSKEKADNGKRKHREDPDQSVKHENNKRRKGEGLAEVGADNDTQHITDSDKNRDKNVSGYVNESKRNVNDSTISGKRDTAKVVEPSTTITKSEIKISDSDLNLKSGSSIDRKNPQRGGNTDLSTSNVKAAHNAKRDDGRRNNAKYGTQSGSQSFNNTSGNRRGDDRRQDNRPRSPPPPLPPPPPPRRSHVRESRIGHGTHTRFFSPDSRDDWAMANRGGREYGGRGHGDIGRRANNSDGRGQNRRRERR